MLECALQASAAENLALQGISRGGTTRSRTYPHSLVKILGLHLESLTTALLNRTRMAHEAIVNLLKFIFNILTHYPKVRFVLTKNLQTIWLPPSSPRQRRGSPPPGSSSPISPSANSLASDPPHEPSPHHGTFNLTKSMLSTGRRSLSCSSSPAQSADPTKSRCHPTCIRPL